MRIKGVSVIALLALCGFLLGLAGPGAVASAQPSTQGEGLVDAGSQKENRPFFEPLDAYCESDCCWAWCSGEGCSVECSSSQCSAQSGGESAKYTCDEM